ncbi:organic cation/carnitine transporter 2-like [Brachionichthys hirsutus]|uniref:organic cation/carnitine transporter 2-like n=1 Tax=Brachionichthys hirsutus TaxID=412623 RepID=UPI0036049D76
MKTYEESVSFLGQWERFQKIAFLLLCASILPNGVYVFAMVFVGASPPHHCVVPDVNHTQAWGSAIIPIQVVDGKQELSRCSRFRLDVVGNLSARGLVPGRDVNLTDVEQEECLDGWTYSKDVYQSTIVTEFDLVCREQWKQPFTASVFFVGILFGSVISGQISDRFGRKPVLVSTMVAQILSNLIQIFSPTWTVFCVFFFITGFSHSSNYGAAFVLGTELLTGNVRLTFSSFGVNFAFALGYMLLPLFAFFLKDWKFLLFAVTLPGLVFIPIWWFIPESPWWLLSVGRVEEAEAIVRMIAKFNKVQAPLVIFSGRGSETNTLPKKYHNVLHLVRTQSMRNPTLSLCLVWLSIRSAYYGLSMGSSQLHADPYISCFVSAVIEIPSYFSIWLAARYFPRRLTLICTLLTTALSVYCIHLIPQSLSFITVALQMMGKFVITVASGLIYLYAVELYPTVIRNTGTGTCSTVARIGSCIVPFVLNLSVYSKYLPQIIFGTMSILSAFAAFFLPETFGKPLPQTIKEMHKRESVTWPCITRREYAAPVASIESGR